jgi:hypothetical protein
VNESAIDETVHLAQPMLLSLPSAQMLLAVVDEMAALAERLEIAGVIVRGVVVEMGCGQQHPRGWQLP